MFYIQSLQTGGTLYWKEWHSSVTTNSFGLFNLVVGNGIRQSESTVATFDAIDWTVTTKYLKTEIYYSGGWHDLGTSQLLTVPYAMVAEDLAGTVKKLSVKGETSSFDEALFEVKNKNGQTIFAVYNEGVRIYVDDGAKGPKGGFAVGGFDMTKATKREYFVVSDDSVRIYLDSNPLTKGKKSGFAVGGYDMTKGVIQNYLDVSADSVRVYIDSNPATKKVKGGFAVGGYDMTKAPGEEYLRVTRDSTRVNVNNNPAKGIKGGFSVGGFDATKGPATPFTSLTPKNYFIGHEGGQMITSGQYNSAIGYQSGKNITTGNSNTLMGYQSGYNNQTGIGNLYIGYQAGHASKTGSSNQFIGYQSGFSNTTGNTNTFIGTYSGLMNTKGSYNTYLGNMAGGLDSLGQYNTYIGIMAGSESQQSHNTYIGSHSGDKNINGYYNSFLGESSGERSSGSENVFLGSGSGYNSGATRSVFLGYSSGYSFSRSNSLIINNNDEYPYESTSLIYGEFDNKVLRINGTVYLPYKLYSGGYAGGAGSINAYSMELGGPSPTATNGYATIFFHHHSIIAHQLRYTSGTLYLEAANGYGTNNTPVLQVGGSLFAAINGGNVGIGTTSTSAKFNVAGSSYLNGTTGINVLPSSSYGLYVSGGSSSALAVNGYSSLGNVGINVTPSASLSLYVSGNSGLYGNTGIMDSPNSNYALQLGTGSTHALYAKGNIHTTGNLTVTGTLTSSGNITASSSLSVGGTLTSSGLITASNGITISSGNLNSRYLINAYDLSVGGSSTLHGITNTGSIYSTGSITTNSNLYVTGKAGVGTSDLSYYNLNVSGVSHFVGNVGINNYNTGIPMFPLDISTSVADFAMRIANYANSTSARGIEIIAGVNTGLGAGEFIRFERYPGGASYDIGSIDENMTLNGVIYSTSSDIRIKENIVDSHFGLDDLMNIKVHDFNFITDPNKFLVTGFIAQELFDIYPDAVLKPTDEIMLWKVDYGRITPLIVKAVQDQQTLILNQQKQIESQQTQIDELKAMVEKLLEKTSPDR
jgi:hypothetical protein